MSKKKSLFMVGNKFNKLIIKQLRYIIPKQYSWFYKFTIRVE